MFVNTTFFPGCQTTHRATGQMQEQFGREQPHYLQWLWYGQHQLHTRRMSGQRNSKGENTPPKTILQPLDILLGVGCHRQTNLFDSLEFVQQRYAYKSSWLITENHFLRKKISSYEPSLFFPWTHDIPNNKNYLPNL